MNRHDAGMGNGQESLRHLRALAVAVVCLAAAVTGSVVGAEPTETNQPAIRVWSSHLLHDSANWPHSERDSRIAGTQTGLRVEVAAERRFAIAAMSGLGLRKDLGQIRVRVAEMGGQAAWFVRLCGALRQPGQRRTAAIAQDEATIGERVFPVDPRLRQLPDAPLQLPLGVTGVPPCGNALWCRVLCRIGDDKSGLLGVNVDRAGRRRRPAAWCRHIAPFHVTKARVSIILNSPLQM